MLYKNCPGIEHIYTAATTTAGRTGVVFITILRETAMVEMTVFLVSHLNASTKPLPLGCARDNLSELHLAILHDHTVLGAALVGKQVDAVPTRFHCRIVEFGGVAGGKDDGILVRTQSIKRAIVDGDAVVALGNHPSPAFNGKASRAAFIWLDDDIANEPNRVGIPKHLAMVLARHLDGLCRKRSRQQGHPKCKNQTFLHGINCF